jgi:hypothetical protein
MERDFQKNPDVVDNPTPGPVDKPAPDLVDDPIPSQKRDAPGSPQIDRHRGASKGGNRYGDSARPSGGAEQSDAELEDESEPSN